MRRSLAVAITVPWLALASAAPRAADPPPVVAELTTLLREFLAGASRNDAATHERFWAEDLIYTGSAGRRIGRTDILRDVRSAPSPGAGEPVPIYTAEDIRILPFGGTAIVAFRLVETTSRDGSTEVHDYLNTGTFLKRDGRWQVVAWQATRLPRPPEESEPMVAAVHDRFHRALLAADVRTLEAILDDGFIWTHDDGDRKTGRQLIDALAAGTLKYSRLEAGDVTVTLRGDSAIVRGTTTRQRRVFPGSGPSGDAAPFASFHTMTFVNLQGRWKAVALHTSRS